MTRDVARRLVFLLLRAGSASAALVLAGGAVPSCFSGGGGGTDPPTSTFYFPVGLAVSSGGNALYAVNSDFDLQWNGGTLQSYDLFLIRRDAAALVHANLTGQTPSSVAKDPYDIDFVNPPSTANCLAADASVLNANNTRVELGQICAPPVQSTKYVRSSTIIGAFGTDLQLQTVNGNVGTRLFAPVRGNATLTWSDVGPDDPAAIPPVNGFFSAFALTCNGDFSAQEQATTFPVTGCANLTGNTVDPADTRAVTMPGEPFGMAQTEDGTAIAVTHQTTTDTSLLTAGLPGPTAGTGVNPSMQFVETDVANGGSGITFVPHDPNSSVPPCPGEDTATDAGTVATEAGAPDGGVGPVPGMRCVRPAFLETNHSTAEVDLLRYYSDFGSSQNRPFISKEAVTPITTNLGGTDSRGIAIDPTPRLACRNVPGIDATTCADTPARVFIANRTPPSIIFGEIGGVSSDNGSYNPDMLTLSGNVPLPAGPSRVYVAPIVNAQGRYEVRVFVVNFDSSTISIYDPNGTNALALVDTIGVGPGPFAMAFDPFDLEDVAKNACVLPDPRVDPRLQADAGASAGDAGADASNPGADAGDAGADAGDAGADAGNAGAAGSASMCPNVVSPAVRRYRFAYVASFTQSFVQVIDLDQTQPTFENVVFTLGNPTPPKGS